MSLDPTTAVLTPPSSPSTLSYGTTASIDATNAYPQGFSINLTTTEIGAYLATVPCFIKITAGTSTQAIWVKNTSGSSPCLVTAVGGTINTKPSYNLISNGQFTVFTGDGAGNLTTS